MFIHFATFLIRQPLPVAGPGGRPKAEARKLEENPRPTHNPGKNAIKVVSN
jgi:hypothetical protein